MTLSLVETPGMRRPPHPDLVAAFDAAVGATPDKTALAYLGRAFTYSELACLEGSATEAFHAAGLHSGDRLIIQLQNVPQFVLALLAAWRLGVIAVPVSPMYRAREVRKLAADSGATAIMMSPALWESQGEDVVEDSALHTVFLTAMEDFADEVPGPLLKSLERAESLPRVPGVDVVDFTQTLAAVHDRGGPARAGVSPDAIAALVYTSGTTGPAKGAMVNHRNLVESAWNYAVVNRVDRPDGVHLGIAPLVHVTGIGVSMATWLLSGSTMVLGYRFHAETALKDIEAWRTTWTAGAPTAFLALLEAAEESPRDTSSLRLATSGGSAAPAAVIERFEKRLGIPILPGFGMTETSGSICSTRIDAGPKFDPESGVPSAGQVHPGVTVSIQDEQGNIVERGQRGEVCLRGIGIVSGYWERPEETAATFRGGWLHTGDVGFMDSDDWLYIVDRTKNLIIASGYKVWPREVEEVITSLAGILEAAVVGVPDPYRGETVKAFVSLRAGAELTEADVIAHCRKGLAAYKVPSGIEFLDSLPKNTNGKILVRELRQHSRAGS